jgi:hypothetical protein
MKKPRKKKSHIKHDSFENYNISPLEHYQNKGGRLIPPLAQLEGMHTTSWVDHGLNEVLWAVILRGNLEQRQCLKIFRQMIVAARESDPLYRDTFISHSALSALGETEFDIIMAPVLQDNSARELLRCLLFLESIPDRPHWARHLEEPDTDTHSQS